MRLPLTKPFKITRLLPVLMLLFAVLASMDSVYHLDFTPAYTEDLPTFPFSSNGLQDLSSEGWGLGNLSASTAERIQNPDNGHWYQRFDDTMTWHDARDYCENLGGYLATITSRAEDDLVYNNLGSFSPHEMVWLGATDEVEEAAWEWVTNELWEYAKWTGGSEPNNCSGIEHYLVYFTPNDPLGRAGRWNDLGTGNSGGCGCDGCTDEWYSMSTICEWERYTVYLPGVMSDYVVPAVFPIFVGHAIPVRSIKYQGEVFYTTSVRLPDQMPVEGSFCFSSRLNVVAEALIDDKLVVLLDQSPVFGFDFSTSGRPTPAIVEVPRSTMEQIAGRTITVEYRDLYAALIGASDIWLIWVP